MEQDKNKTFNTKNFSDVMDAVMDIISEKVKDEKQLPDREITGSILKNSFSKEHFLLVVGKEGSFPVSLDSFAPPDSLKWYLDKNSSFYLLQPKEGKMKEISRGEAATEISLSAMRADSHYRRGDMITFGIGDKKRSFVKSSSSFWCEVNIRKEKDRILYESNQLVFPSSFTDGSIGMDEPFYFSHRKMSRPFKDKELESLMAGKIVAKTYKVKSNTLPCDLER